MIDSDQTDAQAKLSLRRVHTSFDMFCCPLAQLKFWVDLFSKNFLSCNRLLKKMLAKMNRFTVTKTYL